MVAMNISVTPEIAKIIRNKVKSGMYSNASEVVREAVRTLHNTAKSSEYEIKLSALKNELKEGIDQAMRGEFVDISYKDFMKRIRSGKYNNVKKFCNKIFSESRKKTS